MDNTAIMIVRVFHPVKLERDIEVPLNISAYDLFVAINEAFDLGYDTTQKETCYLSTENPISFLVGDKLLSDYGLRNGTVVNVLCRNMERTGLVSNYFRYDFSKASFDCAIDLKSRGKTTIGNETSCDLFEPRVDNPKVKVGIINQQGKYLLEAEKGTKISINGRIVMFDDSPIPIHNYDFINILYDCFYFHNGTLYMGQNSGLKRNGVICKDINESIGAMKYPEFVRNSRLKLKINDEPITLLAPKEKPHKPKSNLLLKLMPAIGMIALTVLLRGVMGGTNLSFILFSVGSVSMGAIVSVFTIINENKEYNQQLVDRQIGYRKYIEDKKKEIEEKRKEELQLLDSIYYRYDETSEFIPNFSGSLFDRIPSDDDFLEIRIGTGTIDAVRKVDYKPQEKYESDDDDLIDLPLQIAEEYRKLSNAPILVQLKNANVVGVVGEDASLYEMMKIMYFDLCIRQHYDDVMTFLIIKEDEIEKYAWIKWFKHINNRKFRNIVCDNQSKDTVFEYLYTELSRRSSSKEKEHLPHIVVFAMDDFGIKEHPVSKFIEKAADYGATFIFFENTRDYIPLGCSQLVLIDSVREGRIIKNENTEIVEFTYVKIADNDLYNASYKLAPVYSQEVSLEGGLTNGITLFELLGVRKSEELDIISRWNSSDVTQSMAVPIGVRNGNEVVYLNIHDNHNDDNAHGPHGLVAGTTGSGKSEVLMTYILSTAISFSPYEVAFLIIDFKAGGMGTQFKNLPHTLGVITDIDGKEIERSLTSIRAEMERRKHLFAEAFEGEDNDHHIDDYIAAWKAKKVSIPLPHLIIIVDEFQELKKQFPDFMEALNTIAATGRTYGVHLILATQKPKGQVDPKVESNSRFRICLKVQSEEDSREVIKTPLAAEIREAGRAYLMVGNNEIFELFQSAYSGASENIEQLSQESEFCVSSIDFAGRRKNIYEKRRKKDKKSENASSQKAAVVGLVESSFIQSGLTKLPGICQPPLETLIEYKESSQIQGTGIYSVLGVYDDPAHQKQERYIVDVSIQHLLIVGSLQSGKTNLLQLIIRDLSEKYTPNEVNFYAIDYSSMILTNFQTLHHMGGVVVPNEEEKLNNLFKLIITEISSRKQRLKAIGVSSYTAYKEAGRNDMPIILLIIDNFAALKERYLGDSNTTLLTILREGLSVGISVVVANGSTKGMEAKYLQYFGCRVGFYHNNSEEYGNLFGVFKMTGDAIPGRGKVSIERAILECQFYLSFKGEKEIDRVREIEAFCKKMNSKNATKRAPLIPVIPEVLMENAIRKEYSTYYSSYDIILGFDYATLQPKRISLSGLNLIVSGIPDSGKGNFAKYIISCLERDKSNAPTEIVIFDRASIKKFESIAQTYTVVSRYEMSPTNMATICQEWKAELELRKQLVLSNNGDMSVLYDKPLLLMICEDSSKDLLDGFDENLFKYFPYKFSWIISSLENIKLPPINAPKLYKAKSAGAGFMFFGNMAASKCMDEYASIQPTDKSKWNAFEMEQGDAFYVDTRDSTKIYRLKTVLHQDHVQ